MNNTNNYTDFIQKLSQSTNIDTCRCYLFADVIIAELTKTLVRGGRLEVRDFGSLSVHVSKNRKMHNPKTGEMIFKPELKRIHFKVSKALKESLKCLMFLKIGDFF